MGIEENKKLVEEYPFLLPRNRWTDEVLEDYDYSFTELDSMPEGWRIRFADDLLKELKEELVSFNYLDDYRIMQIKEKWGMLRWYDNGYPVGELSDEIDEVFCDELEYPKHSDDYVSKYVGRAEDGTYIFQLIKVIRSCNVGKIINKYETLSERVCIECGKDAKWESTGYYLPYCDECAKKALEGFNKNKLDLYMKQNDTSDAFEPDTFEDYFMNINEYLQ